MVLECCSVSLHLKRSMGERQQHLSLQCQSAMTSEWILQDLSVRIHVLLCFSSTLVYTATCKLSGVDIWEEQ